MKFITLEPENFRKFADKSPYKSFMQTPEIANLREQNGWTAYYFGVEDSGKLVAATMAVAKPTFLGKSLYITPGGPLLDYENTELVNFFIKHLKTYAKTHNGYALHISPYYELIERGRKGEVIEGGLNREKALQNLQNLGFKPLKDSSQPKYLFVLDIKNRTPEQIFADFKSNTRNHVRKAEKMGVKIRELGREELDKFKQITASTSKRRHFSDRSLDYYETMYDLFTKRGEIKFLLAEIQQGKTPISTAMFMLYGDEVVYLFSGSDEQYMKDYNAQYLIQWHMIKYAAEHGYKTYNFYGISGLPSDSKPDGIYNFKKGFTSAGTGRVVELIGSFELPVNLPFYYLHQLLARLKHH